MKRQILRKYWFSIEYLIHLHNCIPVSLGKRQCYRASSAASSSAESAADMIALSARRCWPPGRTRAMVFGPTHYKSKCDWLMHLPLSKHTCAAVAFCPDYEVLTNEWGALTFSLPRDNNKENLVGILLFSWFQDSNSLISALNLIFFLNGAIGYLEMGKKRFLNEWNLVNCMFDLFLRPWSASWFPSDGYRWAKVSNKNKEDQGLNIEF